MAVSKIWPLYNTIDRAIDYICNPEKTEDGTLISTYKCTERFAGCEFQDVREHSRKVKNSRIGYHTIISFSPDDPITPEQALEVGREIIEQYLGNKYQYVLACHTDREHIHIHCVSNSVSMEDYKKLQIGDKDLNKLEKITDRVCRTHELSVIETKSGVKGRNKYEYEMHEGGISYKDKLREAIDRSIQVAKDYSDFLQIMQLEEGYEIKEGKYIAFKASGQEKFTRNRVLGERYSIENIKDRIMNKDKNVEVQTSQIPYKVKGKSKRIIDVEHNVKAQKYSAYRKKLNMININIYAEMANFLSRYEVVYDEDFRQVYGNLQQEYSSVLKKLHDLESKKSSLEADELQFKKVISCKKAHDHYLSTYDTDVKFQLRGKYKDYEAALLYLKNNGINLSKITPQYIKQLQRNVEQMQKDIEQVTAEKEKLQSDLNMLSVIQKNNREILPEHIIPHTQEPKKRREAQVR